MSQMSREKGRKGELEASKVFNELFPGVEASRGISQCRFGGKEGADLRLLPKLHVEVKRQKKAVPRNAMAQAIKDAGETGGIPCTLIREDKQPWFFSCRFDDLPQVLRELAPYLPSVDSLMSHMEEVPCE